MREPKLKIKEDPIAGDVNTSVNRETAAAKLEPLYETYKILKTHYEAVPISESNICTKLMEFKGRGNKDSNIFYTDSTLLQNFAKFCLWLNWYTTEPPRDKPPPSAALHFKKIIDTDCFLGVVTPIRVPKTPDIRQCVEHDRKRGFDLNTNPLSNRVIGTSQTGTQGRPGSRQSGAVDRILEHVLQVYRHHEV